MHTEPYHEIDWAKLRLLCAKRITTTPIPSYKMCFGVGFITLVSQFSNIGPSPKLKRGL
ncbi:unnamed protein product, partial [Vitis vinifera]|uniref:Uncharacterized protein n=1 Tax=Vitis vinifera TaxID=29760 RepID=D7TK79_VITVI